MLPLQSDSPADFAACRQSMWGWGPMSAWVPGRATRRRERRRRCGGEGFAQRAVAGALDAGPTGRKVSTPVRMELSQMPPAETRKKEPVLPISDITNRASARLRRRLVSYHGRRICRRPMARPKAGVHETPSASRKGGGACPSTRKFRRRPQGRPSSRPAPAARCQRCGRRLPKRAPLSRRLRRTRDAA